ncbi:MAG: hypothetical protein MRY59_11125 [Aquisalinus sp.]|nr:hypothetical protein [Aquisalinus sp.]
MCDEQIMNKIFDHSVSLAREHLSPENQTELAELMQTYVESHVDTNDFSAEEVNILKKRLENHNQFASHEEVDSFFEAHDL